MSYTKMIKQWEREYNLRRKDEVTEMKKRLESKEKEDARIILSEMMSNINKQEKQKQILLIKDHVILALRKNNPFTYQQYLIIWDILQNDFNQILSDHNMGKINKQEITDGINYVNNFSRELVNDYWRNALLQ